MGGAGTAMRPGSVRLAIDGAAAVSGFSGGAIGVRSVVLEPDDGTSAIDATRPPAWAASEVPPFGGGPAGGELAGTVECAASRTSEPGGDAVAAGPVCAAAPAGSEISAFNGATADAGSGAWAPHTGSGRAELCGDTAGGAGPVRSTVPAGSGPVGSGRSADGAATVGTAAAGPGLAWTVVGA